MSRLGALVSALRALGTDLGLIRGAPDDLHRRIIDLIDDIRAAVARLETSATDLVVVFVGSTGSGTSSVFNAVLGEYVSKTGVRRPTTSIPLVATARHRVDGYRSGGLGGVAVDVVTHPAGFPDQLTLVDAPDPDSVMAGHAATVGALIRAADVVVYVTTPARYADAVPWDLFTRIQDRDVPFIPVMNRIRHDDNGRLQVGHLVQHARLRGMVLDHDEVLRIRETPGRRFPAADDLRRVLEAVVEDDAEEARRLAREGLIGDIAARAEVLIEQLRAQVAAAGRHATDRRNRVAQRRRALSDDLATNPPGASAHGSLILRHRGEPTAAELISLDERLVTAAAADLARRTGATGEEAAAALHRATHRAGAVGMGERVDLLLGLGEHPPPTVRPLDDADRRTFLSVLAEEILPEPSGNGIDVPVSLDGSLDRLREAMS